MEDIITAKEFHEFKTKLDDVHRILLGTEHEEEMGLLPRVKANEKDIASLKDLINKIKWFAGGMMLPASYGMFDFFKAIISAINK